MGPHAQCGTAEPPAVPILGNSMSARVVCKSRVEKSTLIPPFLSFSTSSSLVVLSILLPNTFSSSLFFSVSPAATWVGVTGIAPRMRLQLPVWTSLCPHIPCSTPSGHLISCPFSGGPRGFVWEHLVLLWVMVDSANRYLPPNLVGIFLRLERRGFFRENKHLNSGLRSWRNAPSIIDY